MRLGTCLPDAPGTRLRMRLQDVPGDAPCGHTGEYTEVFSVVEPEEGALVPLRWVALGFCGGPPLAAAYSLADRGSPS